MSIISQDFGELSGGNKSYAVTATTTGSSYTTDKDYPFMVVICPATLTVSPASGAEEGGSVLSTIAGGQSFRFYQNVKAGTTFTSTSSANTCWWFFIEEQ